MGQFPEHCLGEVLLHFCFLFPFHLINKNYWYKKTCHNIQIKFHNKIMMTLELLHAKCSEDTGPELNMALLCLVLRARQFPDELSSLDKRLHLPKCDR